MKFITPIPTSVGALVTGKNTPVRLNPDRNPRDKERIVRFYKLIYDILNAMTPKTKAVLAASPSSTQQPLSHFIESPEVRQRAMNHLMQQVVHRNQGHVVLYTYVPGTLAELGYFLLKLEPPFVYADYILFTPIVRTQTALDTDYNPVPE